jgi:predicted short-subunit dehydrogenase-like oxidoreductase (DUF2520 family)
MNSIPRLGFVGAGVLGECLARLLAGRGFPVVAVASRTPDDAARLALLVGGVAASSPDEVAAKADCVFLTLPDDQLEGVALATRWRAGQVVVHCSGAHSRSALAGARRQGAFIASLHPLQSVATVEEGMKRLSGTLFGAEADPSLRPLLQSFVEALAGQILWLEDGMKVGYHLAATLVSNYTVTLYALGVELLEGLGLPAPEVRRGLLRLLDGTVANLVSLGLPRALTGPLARGDLGTVERHLEFLHTRRPDVEPLYRALGRATVPLALARGGLDPAAAAALAARLG